VPAERELRVAVPGGVLVGQRGGTGAPALLFHGGPAVPDYTEGCARELHGLFEVVRYTQRGVAPSLVPGPYSIESHRADALAVLDAVGWEQAWAVGHSWGGHLALQLLVANPERLLGVVCIDPLGAYGDIFGEYGRRLRDGLTAEQVARLDEIEAVRRAGRVTEAALVERYAAVWPLFFADRRAAIAAPVRVGVECSTETNASIREHFERRTLADGLPRTTLPALFVHGERDPMPTRSATDTARLIPSAQVEIVPACGHFPWAERPGTLRDTVARFLAEHA
jgi:pimeloyl-ACP methyl ester carboxylesterase